MAGFAARIDWQRPGLAPYRAHGSAVAARVAAGASVAAALNAEAVPGAPRFVAADAAGAEGYERYIAATGCVPTRDNAHDCFNGLVWLRFPALKRRLNALHAAELARRGVRPTRGPLGDALTLFDENGALLAAPPALVAALRARDWTRLCVAQRALWAQATLTLIGHALLEKLALAPRKAITAHVMVVEAADADAAARGLTAETFAACPFAPLPLAGVPGWWPGNEAPGFVDDAAYSGRRAALQRPSRDNRRVKRARPPLVRAWKHGTGGRSGLRRAA